MFVAIEGGDGTGKTTLHGALMHELAARSLDVVAVHEPGGTPLGEALRAMLLDVRSDIEPVAEALLYAAARAQLVRDVIRPALSDGRVVVADRFVDSSLAYQGAGRQLGVEMVRQLNAAATGAVRPDLVLLLDAPPEVGAARRHAPPDRLEAEGPAFHARVRDCFRVVAAADPERYRVIDARQSPGEVLAEAVEAVMARCDR